VEARSWAEVRANLTGINKGFLAYTKKRGLTRSSRVLNDGSSCCGRLRRSRWRGAGTAPSLRADGIRNANNNDTNSTARNT